MAVSLIQTGRLESGREGDDIRRAASNEGFLSRPPPTQGQRQLTPVCPKDFEHELWIPATRAAFHDQAAFSGVLLEQ
jgi:hypothetical protein